MFRSRTPRNVVLAIAGLALAVAVGLAANAVSEDSIGLSPQPLSSQDALAPPQASETKAAQRRAQRRRAARHREGVRARRDRKRPIRRR